MLSLPCKNQNTLVLFSRRVKYVHTTNKRANSDGLQEWPLARQRLIQTRDVLAVPCKQEEALVAAKQATRTGNTVDLAKSDYRNNAAKSDDHRV